ncbi:MAG: hypothetical protein HOE02_08410 [Candidatus Marinimicrobia bacterium]|jgi:hypothetical protein|nr:hypothetical protein [Candidatus Neomarinimicrobiota bacterium]MBT4178288.1 hypothetical protein [Candidatus Neomarinimicrobiota bacterium]
MNLGHWLNSLDAWDHLVIFLLFGLGFYASRKTFQFLKRIYEKNQKENLFSPTFRITPLPLLGLAILYTIILYQFLGDFINIVLEQLR